MRASSPDGLNLPERDPMVVDLVRELEQRIHPADVIELDDPWLDALHELEALHALAAREALEGVEAQPAVVSIPASRRGGRALIAAGAALVLVSLPSVAHALSPSAPPAVMAPVAAVATPHHQPVLSQPTPLRITIPSIRLASQLLHLQLAPGGALQKLTDVNRPAWYAGGPVPGNPGVALIVGHVDSYQGPAVFQKLEQLRPGDAVSIQRTDGSVVRFVVDRLASYPKNAFPTHEVFAATAPELRLITCFGSFDRTRKSYTRNLVVYASLAAPVSPPAQSRPRTAPHLKEVL